MITNEYGQVFFDTHEILDSMYSNISDMSKYVESQRERTLWNKNCKHFDIDPIDDVPIPSVDPNSFHKSLSSTWLIPAEYDSIDIHKLLVDKMQQLNIFKEPYTAYLTEEIESWYKLFPQGPEKLWKFLNYMIETCKQHDIVTGVGRGSSVSSLVLYLLDVHCIDPVKYNLNYKEFLR